jgi:hypothetical protein
MRAFPNVIAPIAINLQTLLSEVPRLVTGTFHNVDKDGLSFGVEFVVVGWIGLKMIRQTTGVDQDIGRNTIPVGIGEGDYFSRRTLGGRAVLGRGSVTAAQQFPARQVFAQSQSMLARLH